MIIRDEDVQAALDWLNQDPHPLAVAEYRLTEAKNHREETYARLYLQTGGTVGDRECQVEVDTAYRTAKAAEALMGRDLANEKTKRTWADKVCDLYQTVSANTRYAERIR